MKFIFSRLVTLLTIAVAVSGCQTMKAIDHGLYSATEAVTEKDRVTGARTISLADRKAQIEMGNQIAEEFIAKAKAEGKKINEELDADAYDRIVTISNRLHSVSHLRDEAWAPTLVESDTWNAFTTGGTYFIIFSALEHDLPDDNELANVIAHEMAHTVANHVFEQASYTRLNSLAGSNSAKRGTFQAAFTHESEAEADRIAVLYCALAGFDPYAGVRIWKRMHESVGSNASIIHDHPMNNERAKLAEQTAKLVEKYYTPNKIHPDFANILENNELFAAKTTDAEAGKGGGLLAVLDAAVTTYTQRQQAKAEERRQAQRIQFMSAVNKVSTLVDSKAISANTWRFTVKYNGNLALTDLGFKATFHKTDGSSITLTEQIQGILRPNTTFNVDFASEDLPAFRVNPRNIEFRYDTARSY